MRSIFYALAQNTECNAPSGFISHVIDRQLIFTIKSHRPQEFNPGPLVEQVRQQLPFMYTDKEMFMLGQTELIQIGLALGLISA